MPKIRGKKLILSNGDEPIARQPALTLEGFLNKSMSRKRIRQARRESDRAFKKAMALFSKRPSPDQIGKRLRVKLP